LGLEHIELHGQIPFSVGVSGVVRPG
jgi:hypothetical protein